eukprot:CAMPEP_0119030352 /NCGR_PEP_ID=MMETSP1176-20130426/40989_1 /TAXON_ID=265551 /ORGANISM="Synedropsis recta cf, Strain CCMP1620" /LENGTH=80 /DNA_ID=CAMNT_0006986721 /DNA_START=1012 /DNA_END=1254 /DNA_ORIENTATION=+
MSRFVPASILTSFRTTSSGEDNVGKNSQSKLFTELSSGPHWLSPEALENQKHDIALGQKEKDKVKHQLIRDLASNEHSGN